MIVEVLVLENNFENLCYNINFFFFRKKIVMNLIKYCIRNILMVIFNKSFLYFVESKNVYIGKE